LHFRLVFLGLIIVILAAVTWRQVTALRGYFSSVRIESFHIAGHLQTAVPFYDSDTRYRVAGRWQVNRDRRSSTGSQTNSSIVRISRGKSRGFYISRLREASLPGRPDPVRHSTGAAEASSAKKNRAQMSTGTELWLFFGVRLRG
jgi:hypothetical protein